MALGEARYPLVDAQNNAGHQPAENSVHNEKSEHVVTHNSVLLVDSLEDEVHEYVGEDASDKSESKGYGWVLEKGAGRTDHDSALSYAYVTERVAITD